MHALLIPAILALAAVGHAGPPSFTEEAPARGVIYDTTMGGVAGHGVCFADLDDDGDPDLVALGAANGVVGVFENLGGVFTDRSAADGVPPLTKHSGVIAGDIDNDGDLDLYVARWGWSNRLFRNDGNFQFTDITFAAGVGDSGDTAGCGFADFDLDGRLDLYVGTMHGPNRLYRNLGDNVFTDVAPALGVDESDQDTFQASFVDYDRDGDPDLYCANAHGQYCDSLPYQNRLYRNDGGVFTDVTSAAGAEACVDSMSIAIGDLDGNGFDDLYITNLPDGHALLLNQGDGTFVQDEVAAGVATYDMGWGAVFFDCDNDGHTDLYVCGGNAPNRLYRHDGAFPCEDVAPAAGVDLDGFSYCVATADIDDDGDLDLVVQNNGEPLRLYVNQQDDASAWAKFDVQGPNLARHAVGALLEVRTDAVTRVREVVAGSNFKSQNDLVQHVGLAAAAIIDEVTVTWPGGAARTLGPLPARETWTLHHPDRLGDANGDGLRTLPDFFAYLDCRGDVAPGCEMMDIDGDGVIDEPDLLLLLDAFDEPLADCNRNGVADLVEIAAGDAPDADENGVIDDCEAPPATPGDLNDDGVVDASDLAMLLAAWGGPDADLDDDGVTGASDLAMLLADWS